MKDFSLFMKHARALGFERRWVVLIIGLQFVSVLFEGIGLGMFLPILQYIRADGDMAALTADSDLWEALVTAFERVGLPVNLATLLTVSFLMFGFRQLFQYLRLLFTNKVKFGMVRKIRCETFDMFVRADISLHDNLKSGNFVNEMTIEVTNATGCLIAYINFVGLLIMGVVYAGWLILLSPMMTISAIAIFAMTALALTGLMSKGRRLGYSVTAINQEVGQFLVQRLQALRLIRLAGMETAESSEVRGLANTQHDHLVSLTAITAATQVLAEPIILFGGFVLLYLSLTILDLPIEVVLIVFAVMFRMLPVVKEALIRRQAFLSALGSVDAVTTRSQELAAAAEVCDKTLEPGRLATAITFENVSFAYNPDGGIPALKDVSLTIDAQNITAIVGPSGAGKSTLIDMLPRLRHPDSGRILYDGTPLDDFNLVALRRKFAFAPQTPLMMDVTVAEHIAYGSPDVTQADIERAARLANAHEFIMELSDGYRTRIGEGGKQLSGGQRQRLDLARTLTGSASVLILDEPTSALDVESEARFIDALRTIRRETDITVIVIAHRFNTISMADRIVVMENGLVTENGTHRSLADKGGWYSRMVDHNRVLDPAENKDHTIQDAII